MPKKGKKMPVEASNLMPTESNDFMTNIIAKSHAQVKKKDKKKNDISDILGENTLELIDGPKTIKKVGGMTDWSKIKTNGAKAYRSQPVEFWSEVNFFQYFKARCKEKNIVYKEIIDQEIGHAVRTRFINKIKKTFLEKIGQPVTNTMLGEYIDYYINHEIDDVVAVNGVFSSYDITSRRIINRFLNLTNKNKNTQAEPINDQPKNLIDIEHVYSTGGTNLLCTYGIVVPYNWLIIKKNLTPIEAKNVINRFFNDAQNEGDLVVKAIKDTSSKLSPYIDKYQDENVHAMLYEYNLSSVDFSVDGNSYF
jgi:hypothetical protein